MMSLAPDSPAVAHGLGLFETILITDGRPIQLAAHYERMADSSARLGLPVPGADAFRHEVEGAARNATGESSVRCIWVAAEESNDAGSWILHASLQPIRAATLSRRERGRAITLPPHWSRSLPRHKTTSWAVCLLALRQAIASNADEAVFTAADATLLEGTSTNLFAIRPGTLVTANVEAGVLPGVVRAWVIDQAARLGARIEWRPPSRDEIMEGAFFTGSLTKLAPLRVLDGETCAPPGELFDELRRLYELEAVSTQ
jgi:4-amino-4-deoxychorismate lyase